MSINKRNREESQQNNDDGNQPSNKKQKTVKYFNSMSIKFFSMCN